MLYELMAVTLRFFHSGHIRVKQNSFFMRVMQRQNQNLWGETSMQRHYYTDKKYSEKTIVSFMALSLFLIMRIFARLMAVKHEESLNFPSPEKSQTQIGPI